MYLIAGSIGVFVYYFTVQHAEINAINNKISDDLKGCTMYVTSFPCNKCTSSIIESGITTVICSGEIQMKEKNKMAAAGVTYRY